MKRDAYVTGRATPATKEFLKKHKISVGDALEKYVEMMGSEKDQVCSQITTVKNELAVIKRKEFLLEMELEDLKEQLKRINGGEVKSVEDECVKELGEMLLSKGFCKNNQNPDIFNNIDIMEKMSDLTQRCNLDVNNLKGLAIDYVLQE